MEINPLVLKSQVYGGATIGLGYALTKRLIEAPTTANAIYDAVSVRVKDLPIRPKKVLASLKERRKC
jgi:CO/xanthine dehydrogenase Mo-binding subunit